MSHRGIEDAIVAYREREGVRARSVSPLAANPDPHPYRLPPPIRILAEPLIPILIITELGYLIMDRIIDHAAHHTDYRP